MATDLQLAAILGGLSVREGRRIDVPSLAEGWRAFVRAVERGEVTPEDYPSSLENRDLLAEVIASVSPAARRQIQELVTPDDDAYRAATRVVDNPRRSVRADRWWWTRIPAGLGNYTETSR